MAPKRLLYEPLSSVLPDETWCLLIAQEMNGHSGRSPGHLGAVSDREGALPAHVEVKLFATLAHSQGGEEQHTQCG